MSQSPPRDVCEGTHLCHRIIMDQEIPSPVKIVKKIILLLFTLIIIIFF